MLLKTPKPLISKQAYSLSFTKRNFQGQTCIYTGTVNKIITCLTDKNFGEVMQHYKSFVKIQTIKESLKPNFLHL